MSGFSSSFCILPWIHSFVNNGGEYQVCCTGEEFKNFIKNDENKIVNISDQLDIDLIMNSNFMKKFRLEMLNGKLPASCERCRITEKCGGQSRRVIENTQYEYLISDLINNTNKDGSIGSNILHIDYRLGNSCNLQCRMCNPRASKRWVKQHKELPENLQDKDFKDNIDDYLKVLWNENKILLEDFEAKCSSVERLHFGGGEPLVSMQMKGILEYCIQMGISKNITLSYNTNLTILEDDLLELWKNFKAVKLLVSIDGIGKVNDYIRYPSKWKTIDENLEFLDLNGSNYNITELMISTTVQLNNILHLHELFDYLKKFKQIKQIPNLILLFFPECLQANLLPKKLRFMAELSIQNLIEKVSSDEEIDSYLLQNLKQIQNYLASPVEEEYRKSNFSKFIEFSNEFDKDKKINLEYINPEFQSFCV